MFIKKTPATLNAVPADDFNDPQQKHQRSIRSFFYLYSILVWFAIKYFQFFICTVFWYVLQFSIIIYCIYFVFLSFLSDSSRLFINLYNVIKSSFSSFFQCCQMHFLKSFPFAGATAFRWPVVGGRGWGSSAIIVQYHKNVPHRHAVALRMRMSIILYSFVLCFQFCIRIQMHNSINLSFSFPIQWYLGIRP